jgi:hypothetical protein
MSLTIGPAWSGWPTKVIWKWERILPVSLEKYVSIQLHMERKAKQSLENNLKESK